MEKKANSFAVITVSVIAALAAIGAAIYFLTRYINKKNQECYDFADYYDPDEMYDYDDCDCDCDCCIDDKADEEADAESETKADDTADTADEQ